MSKSKWIKKWQVQGSNNNVWTVAIDKDGNYGCSCPVWRFKRQECHHILQIKTNGGEPMREKPIYTLACVRKPEYDEKENRLLIPLIGIPDLHMMEATICFYMLKYGYSWGEVKNYRTRIPQQWTAKAVIAYVQEYGEACYPPNWYKR